MLRPPPGPWMHAAAGQRTGARVPKAVYKAVEAEEVVDEEGPQEAAVVEEMASGSIEEGMVANVPSRARTVIAATEATDDSSEDFTPRSAVWGSPRTSGVSLDVSNLGQSPWETVAAGAEGNATEVGNASAVESADGVQRNVGWQAVEPQRHRRERGNSWCYSSSKADQSKRPKRRTLIRSTSMEAAV